MWHCCNFRPLHIWDEGWTSRGRRIKVAAGPGFRGSCVSHGQGQCTDVRRKQRHQPARRAQVPCRVQGRQQAVPGARRLLGGLFTRQFRLPQRLSANSRFPASVFIRSRGGFPALCGGATPGSAPGARRGPPRRRGGGGLLLLRAGTLHAEGRMRVGYCSSRSNGQAASCPPDGVPRGLFVQRPPTIGSAASCEARDWAGQVHFRVPARAWARRGRAPSTRDPCGIVV